MVCATEGSDDYALAAADWMQQTGMLSEQGHVADPFISVQTVIGHPVLRGECASRFSLSKALEDSGWRASSDKLRPSMRNKVFNRAQALEYFQLLHRHCDAARAFDDAYTFRHSQSKASYDAMLSSFLNRPEDSNSTISD